VAMSRFVTAFWRERDLGRFENVRIFDVNSLNEVSVMHDQGYGRVYRLGMALLR